MCKKCTLVAVSKESLRTVDFTLNCSDYPNYCGLYSFLFLELPKKNEIYIIKSWYLLGYFVILPLEA